MTAYTGGSPTFTAGQKTGNVDRLNQIRDLGRAFTDPWTAWPTSALLTQGVTVSGTVTGGFMQAGKLVIATYNIAVTSSGTASTIIELALPVPAAGAYRGGGSWWHFDSGNTNYTGFAGVYSTTKARFYRSGDASGPHGVSAGQLTSGDNFVMQLTYEAA